MESFWANTTEGRFVGTAVEINHNMKPDQDRRRRTILKKFKPKNVRLFFSFNLRPCSLDLWKSIFRTET